MKRSKCGFYDARVKFLFCLAIAVSLRLTVDNIDFAGGHRYRRPIVDVSSECCDHGHKNSVCGRQCAASPIKRARGCVGIWAGIPIGQASTGWFLWSSALAKLRVSCDAWSELFLLFSLL